MYVVPKRWRMGVEKDDPASAADPDTAVVGVYVYVYVCVSFVPFLYFFG